MYSRYFCICTGIKLVSQSFMSQEDFKIIIKLFYDSVTRLYQRIFVSETKIQHMENITYICLFINLKLFCKFNFSLYVYFKSIIF